jgi:hypothetical protein
VNLRPLAGLLWLAAIPVAADEVAIPVAVEPVGVQVAPRVVPQRMLVPEALRLFETLRQRIPEASAAPAAEAVPEADAGRRVFEVEAPAATNPGTTFAFEDVTDRSTVRESLTVDQRRAAVEAFRRAVAARRAKGE